MAEPNPEPHHVPQQNRRNKLRFTTVAATATAVTTTQTTIPSSTTTLLPSFFQLDPPSIPCFPLNLNLQQNDAVSIFSGDFLKQDLRSSVPLGPFTGYASILMRSRFLKPAEQILDNFCGVYVKDALGFHGDHGFSESGIRDVLAFSERKERSWKNSKLFVILEEVYMKYKVYCQQMQTVVASFETVAGLGNAAPFVSCAIKSVSKHFCCLKNVILDQIQLSSSSSSSSSGKRVWSNDQYGSIISSQNYSRFNDQQKTVWRSQRGLPDHAVSVLKTWLYQNFLHPYPTDSEKQMLAQQTGLSRTQVSNWFINARVRLWKPMVEEIHTLETRQAAQTPAPPEVVAVNHNINKHSDHKSDKIPQSEEPHQSLPVTKRPCRRKISPTSNNYNPGDHDQVQQNASYCDPSTNQQPTAGIVGTSVRFVPVTLALGLHHGYGTSQHFKP